MESFSKDGPKRPRLVDEIKELAHAAFGSTGSGATPAQRKQELDTLIEK